MAKKKRYDMIGEINDTNGMITGVVLHDRKSDAVIQSSVLEARSLYKNKDLELPDTDDDISYIK